MSDRRLRELERLWKETGSPDDEAAFLLERVRVGDLTRERLELAAYCGHEAARRAVGEGGHSLPQSDRQWIHGLGSHGKVPAVIAARVAAGLALATVRMTPGTPEVPEAKQALDAIDAWLACPCSVHEEQVLSAKDAVTSAPWTAIPWLSAAALAVGDACLALISGDSAWAQEQSMRNGVPFSAWSTYPEAVVRAVGRCVWSASASASSGSTDFQRCLREEIGRALVGGVEPCRGGRRSD